MDWIKYRNYLMSLACTMNTATIEYKNINRRIRYAQDRAYR